MREKQPVARFHETSPGKYKCVICGVNGIAHEMLDSHAKFCDSSEHFHLTGKSLENPKDNDSSSTNKPKSNYSEVPNPNVDLFLLLDDINKHSLTFSGIDTTWQRCAKCKKRKHYIKQYESSYGPFFLCLGCILKILGEHSEDDALDRAYRGGGFDSKRSKH